MIITSFSDTRRRIGHIHIPKTGGKSVRKSLLDLDDDTGRLFSMQNTKHWTYSQYMESPKGFVRYGQPDVWFTTVRHPASKWLSWYHYTMFGDKLARELSQTKKEYEIRYKLFEEYGPNECIMQNKELVKKLEKIMHLPDCYKSPSVLQFSFIEGAKNIVYFDIETQANELFAWLRKQGYPVEYVHTNRNERNTTAWQEVLTDKTRSFLYSKYYEDYKYFNYEK